MKKILVSVLLFLFSGAVKRAASNYEEDTARVKMSVMYLKLIKTCRLLFISLLGIGICLNLGLVGLVLLHATLFLYTPLSTTTQMIIGFGSAALYIGAAAFAFSRLFAQDEWLKMFH